MKDFSSQKNKNINQKILSILYSWMQRSLLLFKYCTETHSKCTFCISTKKPPNRNGTKLLKRFIFILINLKYRYNLEENVCCLCRLWQHWRFRALYTINMLLQSLSSFKNTCDVLHAENLGPWTRKMPNTSKVS